MPGGAMAYNSALQRTGGTARNLHVVGTVECRWGFRRPPLSFMR
jgi:hypothetical protein